MFKRRNSGFALTRAEALDCVPIRSNQVVESRLDSGEVILAYPAYPRPWLANLTRRLRIPVQKTRKKKLQLDALGTSVWHLLDGRRSVLQVVQRFAAKHRLHIKEAEVSVTQFLRELGRRGLIGLK